MGVKQSYSGWRSEIQNVWEKKADLEIVTHF
jgi:hypothetical protein